jgi:Zn-dependent M28 family amino/carboxypeptidase
MNNKIRMILICFALIVATSSSAEVIPDSVYENAIKLRDKAMQATIAYDIVESLTMEVGPRPAGSEADAKAVQWAMQKLTSLGFKNVRREHVEVPHWERGSLDVRITDPVDQSLLATSLGGSIGTVDEGIEAAVLRVESLADLRVKKRQEVANRIVYFDHVMERNKHGSGYSSAARIRSCGHSLAAERGAVATVIRSAGTSTHRFPHTGGMIKNNVPAVIPGIALSNADADILSFKLSSDTDVSMRILSTARTLPNASSANVIAEIPGYGSQSDEIVLLAAHLDSWDLGTGALDDGAGVAIVTAAAKMILDSGVRPRRTIRIVLYANEEFGLSGAKQYAKKHAETINKHIVGIESDFGADPIWLFATNVDESSLNLVNEIQALLSPLGIERGGNQSTSGGDLGPLRKSGMPIFELRPKGDNYFDYHHTADDTLDKVGRKSINQNVAAFVAAIYVVANIKQSFGRIAVDSKPSSTCAAEYD